MFNPDISSTRSAKVLAAFNKTVLCASMAILLAILGEERIFVIAY